MLSCVLHLHDAYASVDRRVFQRSDVRKNVEATTHHGPIKVQGKKLCNTRFIDSFEVILAYVISFLTL